jgi:hypothetical protein
MEVYDNSKEKKKKEKSNNFDLCCLIHLKFMVSHTSRHRL